MHLNFDLDIIEGERGQAEVNAFLEQTYGASLLSSNETKRYDCTINIPTPSPLGQGIMTVEIKTDFLVTPERDTGNLFIEVNSRGKRSGINVCTGDWFLYYFKHLRQLWAIKPDTLLALLVVGVTTGKLRVVGGGDIGSGTQGILVPRDTHHQHFHVWHMPTETPHDSAI